MRACFLSHTQLTPPESSLNAPPLLLSLVHPSESEWSGLLCYFGSVGAVENVVREVSFLLLATKSLASLWLRAVVVGGVGRVRVAAPVADCRL